MELKEQGFALQPIAGSSSSNPFNGIESHTSLYVGLALGWWNPFNGIESASVLYPTPRILAASNPFNGIERAHEAEAPSPTQHQHTRIHSMELKDPPTKPVFPF